MRGIGNHRREPILAKPKRAASYFKKFLLTLCSLLLSAAVLEIGTRLVSDIQPPLFRSHATLGMTYQPNFHGTVYVAESGKYVELRFNSDGMRGPDCTIDKPVDVRRIAVIGDSMTAAIATDEEDTLVRVLETQLSRAQPKQKWEVMNFSVSGSSTAQELVFYREIARKYRPDIVVCAFYVGNDLTDNCRDFSHHANRVYFDLDAGGELYELPRSVERSNLSAWLNLHSRFYVWQKQAIGMLALRLREQANQMSDRKLAYLVQPTADVEHAWRITEKLIDKFREEVSADGAQFVLAVIPSCDQIHHEHWQDVLARAGDLAEQMNVNYPLRRLGEFCTRIGVPLVDLTPAFRRASPSRLAGNADASLYYNGDGHLNVAGNRVAAEQIHAFLERSTSSVVQTPRESVRR